MGFGRLVIMIEEPIYHERSNLKTWYPGIGGAPGEELSSGFKPKYPRNLVAILFHLFHI